MNISPLILGLAFLAWLAFFGSIGYSMAGLSSKPLRSHIARTVALFLLAGLLTTLRAGLLFIQPQERGVVVSAIQPTGYRDVALEPGLHWIVPFFESVERYSIAKQTYTMSKTPAEGAIHGDDSVTARTSDGQEVFIDASFIFFVDPNQAVHVHIIWQDRFIDDLVRAQARGIIRDAAAQYGIEEIYSTRRDEFAGTVEDNMSQILEANGLKLDSFILRNITFSPEYADSIERKQIAEQEVQRAVFVVQQREQEAEQLRAQAKGQADAAVIAAEGAAQAIEIEAAARANALLAIGAALNSNPDLLEYTYVENLSDDVEIMLVPSNSPYLFSLPELESNSTLPLSPTVPAESP